MTHPALLLVEDDPELVRFLKPALEAAGWQVDHAASCQEARSWDGGPNHALVILDLGLPDGDGLDLLRDIRARKGPPVLVLSARHQEEQKIAALDAGAEDYVTKPFSYGELMARIRVLGRRNRNITGYVLDGLEIDLERHRVLRNGQPVHLTATEFRLLEQLARQPGKVLTHRKLLAAVWGLEAVDQTHYLRIYMGQLRAKLEQDSTQPRFLLTETGVGYRLAEE
jgi:two-component system, OmpR family, KDP operon response regulator KdpE